MAPKRAASPALSESGFDLTNKLTAEDAFSGPLSLGDGQGLNFGLDSLYENKDGGGSDDEAFIAAQQAASNRKASALKGRTVKKGGGFQAMGFNPILLKAIARKGFTVPTPIQRKTIPLIMEGRDVVGMARTGSGKTAAFVLPMIEKLKAHSAKFGCRAIILSPSRELALQTLKVVKELGRGTDLRSILLIGGDSLEDQFTAISTNPDIIIATPGRLMHLKVETGLDLSAVQYVVFDEADRLFEMGFAVQLTEILHALPTRRRTLLFSATLPQCLVEFTKAGLQDPQLIRLDVDSKISPELQSAFFTVKGSDREGALLYLLEHVVKIPTGPTKAALELKESEDTAGSKKRKRMASRVGNKDSPTEFSTIVFAATKHCVEYISALLTACGYSISMVYGSLDQTARKTQVQNFRSGLSHILVVTDVAARGIDIPILANVINYNFPSQPKIYIHRVGRTARAGRTGWSYSLVRDTDIPYLLDLQLFLGRNLVLGADATTSSSERVFHESVVLGSFPPSRLGASCEDALKMQKEDYNISSMKKVSVKGESLYERTRNSASAESVKRGKLLTVKGDIFKQNPLFNGDPEAETEKERERMLNIVRGFRPQETVFELNRKKDDCEISEMAKRRRLTVLSWKQRKQDLEDKQANLNKGNNASDNDDGESEADSDDDAGAGGDSGIPSEDDAYGSSDDDDGLEVTMFSDAHPTKSASAAKAKRAAATAGNDDDAAAETWRDTENFVTYEPRTYNPYTDTAYAVTSGTASKLADGSAAGTGSSFAEAARAATLDLDQDESRGFALASRAGGAGAGSGSAVGMMRWDKKARKYVSRTHDLDGSRTNTKMIRSEAGLKIAASFKSGRFEAWKKANRVGRLPRVGEAEANVPAARPGSAAHTGHAAIPGLDRGRDGKPSAVKLGAGGTSVSTRFVHRQNKAPKQADRFRDDFETQKKKLSAAKERNGGVGGFGKGRAAAKSEVRGLDKIHKERKMLERRRERNGRPTKTKGKGRK